VDWVEGRWGWRQEVSFTLEEIWRLLREQNGHLKRIAQGLDRAQEPVVKKLRIPTIRS